MATRSAPAGSHKASKRGKRPPLAAEQFGRFQILEDIGQGGMSRVFRAYDPLHKREVAIKTLPHEYRNDLGFRLRFEREGKLVTALGHESIVPVYEVGEQDGQPFIVMQYMPFGSLAGRTQLGPLAPRKAAEILERIASALDYAHTQDIIHRDLKPSNVLFDGDGRAYLTDFGIALQAQSAWESNLAITGTPAYMSPEQVLREALDERSDIYSLGILAFEMLSGRPPFEHESPMAVALMQVYDSPPPLGSARGADLYEMEPVVRRALAKSPQERYPTAVAFAEAFRRALQPDKARVDGAGPGAISSEVQELPSDASPAPLPVGADLSSPPQRIAHFPALPEMAPRRSRPLKPAGWQGWGGRHILAMALVSWMGLLLASIVAALLWGGVRATNADMLMVYDENGVALINISGGSLDLRELAFQRISSAGQVTAAFPAIQWQNAGLQPVDTLGAGACYQLLNPAIPLAPLIPGEAPAKPDECQVSQGWLLAQSPDWHFWMAQGESQAFRVLLRGQAIQTCQIAQGSCQFVMKGP